MAGELTEAAKSPVSVVGSHGGKAEVALGPFGQLVITLDAEGPEKKGRLVLRECIYGWEILYPFYHDDFPIGLLDLFYSSPEAKNLAGPPVQLVVHSPLRDDPIGRLRWFNDRAEIDFEYGVERKEVDGQVAYVYQEK
jgi:hypothetical protein